MSTEDEDDDRIGGSVVLTKRAKRFVARFEQISQVGIDGMLIGQSKIGPAILFWDPEELDSWITDYLLMDLDVSPVNVQLGSLVEWLSERLQISTGEAVSRLKDGTLEVLPVLREAIKSAFRTHLEQALPETIYGAFSAATRDVKKSLPEIQWKLDEPSTFPGPQIPKAPKRSRSGRPETREKNTVLALREEESKAAAIGSKKPARDARAAVQDAFRLSEDGLKSRMKKDKKNLHRVLAAIKTGDKSS